MRTAIKPTDDDLKWLAAVYPSFHYDEKGERLAVELDIRACYEGGRVRSEGIRIDESIRQSKTFMQGVFEVEIRLSPAIGTNGWPSVYETGGRVESIARKWDVPKIDLHLFEDNAFCLGLNCAAPRRFFLRWFVRDLVVPFLYKLAYTERFGVDAAEKELWRDYPHGQAGHDEYAKRLEGFALRVAGRNGPCPCGSGKKAKKCCLDEIETWKREATSRVAV